MAEREPEEIRAEIEETREQLGETVEALAHKTDVRGNAKAKVEETKERFTRRTEDAKAKIADASPEQAAGAAAGLRQKAREQPLPFAVAAAFAGGLAVGVLLARRRR